jgi:hypothetical protein
MAEEVAQDEVSDAHLLRRLDDHGRLDDGVARRDALALALRPLEHEVVGKVDAVEAVALGGMREVAQLRPVEPGELEPEFYRPT